MAGLTWNHRNVFADGLGVEDDRGLTALGEEVVDLLAELGVMLDLSHASPRTFDDVLARAPGATVLVSHACCRALCDTPRNLTDEQLRAIAGRGGVIGMMALPLTVDPDRPTIERLADHVDHAVGVAGIEHVGLGGDFIRQVALATGMTEIPGGLFPPGMEPGAAIEGLEGPAGYPALVTELKGRGYTGERLEAILAGNWLRIFRAGLPGLTLAPARRRVGWSRQADGGLSRLADRWFDLQSSASRSCSPSRRRPRRPIAPRSPSSSDLGLMSVGSDGTGVTMLRDGPARPSTLPPCPGAEAATWSPDGSTLAAVVGTQLWLFGTDGTSRLLPTGVAVSGRSSPAWSPDGPPHRLPRPRGRRRLRDALRRPRHRSGHERRSAG